MIQSHYIGFSRQFKQHLSGLSYGHSLRLGLDICKRLFFEYRAFVHANDWGNPDVLLGAIAFLESGGTDPVAIEKQLFQVEQVTPDTDDFNDSSYALHACTAVLGLLSFVKNEGNQSHLFDTGAAYYDTIAEKVQEEEGLSESEVARHLLILEAKRFLLHKDCRLP